jgi:putative endopeptidase
MKTALIAGLVACLTGPLQAGAAAAQDAKSAEPAESFGPWGFDVAGMDRAEKPGDDFFKFADGTYVDKLVIPADKTGYGNFNILADETEREVHDVLDEAARPGAARSPEAAKVGAYFTAYMDADTVELRGSEPLKPYLAAIQGVSTKEEFAALIGKASGSLYASPLAVSVSPDAKDPTRYSVGVEQSGLGLPDRDYYLKPDFADKRAKYQQYVAQMLDMAGWPDSAAAAAEILAFETKVAEVSWTRADRRDPQKTYNPLTPDALVQAAPGVDWPLLLKSAAIPPQDYVVLSENTAVVGIAKLIGETDLATLKAWEAFHVVKSAAPYLPARFVDANFAFNSTYLQGVPTISERWKRALRSTNAMLGEAVGQLYVEKYFPPESMAKMEKLTQDVKAAYRARLERNEWMSPATREKALAKLDAFATQIGYPKKWRDYSSYDVEPADLFGNVERGQAFEWKRETARLGTKVDRDEWEMTPQTVNAYNMPSFNEIVFPAAILQPPFFNAAADPAINYGGIGGVIGHEMTHSFDDQGRKFDAEGRLSEWWTADDAAKFDALAKRLGAQFAAMEPLPGAHINPQLTMGENIADLGGLTLALDAYHASLEGKPAPVVDGMTGDQRVFLGWAQVWRSKQRPEAERQALMTDPHSPAVARVNGPVANIDAWYDAFGVRPGDAMYVKPEDRVRIW